MPFRTAGIACLLISFLVAALAPCPTRVDAGGAHGHPSPGRAADVAQASADEPSAGTSITAACPCGCERPPVAGQSARLGVALPSDTPNLTPARATAPAPTFDPPHALLFASRIEHVPLFAVL